MKEEDKAAAENKFMRKFTLRELIQEYYIKRGWGLADVLLDREYIMAEECEHCSDRNSKAESLCSEFVCTAFFPLLR